MFVVLIYRILPQFDTWANYIIRAYIRGIVIALMQRSIAVVNECHLPSLHNEKLKEALVNWVLGRGRSRKRNTGF